MEWDGWDGMEWDSIHRKKRTLFYWVGVGGAETDGDGLTDHRAPRTDQ